MGRERETSHPPCCSVLEQDNRLPPQLPAARLTICDTGAARNGCCRQGDDHIYLPLS